MTDRHSPTNRRQFVKLTSAGLVAASLASTLSTSTARAAESVSEADPTAAALGYKADATKAAARKDPAAFCSGCALYSGQPGGSEGPCSVFGGKLVSAKGWCTAWAKKA